MIRDYLAVALGGAAGSVLRYALTGLLAHAAAGGFPVATWVVNAAGSFLIGVLLTWVRDHTLLLLLVTGFCGGFTTFSTFSADTVQLLRAGAWGTAGSYVVLSVGCCLVAAAAGFGTGKLLQN